MILYNITLWALVAAAVATILIQGAFGILAYNREKRYKRNLKNRIGLDEITGYIARDADENDLWLFNRKPVRDKDWIKSSWIVAPFDHIDPLLLPQELVPSQLPGTEPRQVKVKIEIYKI